MAEQNVITSMLDDLSKEQPFQPQSVLVRILSNTINFIQFNGNILT
jgi:hypothetical protein